MEVVRDRADNCIIICSIENIDPMGVHTGDSITVAPALTLTDKEYQIMRNASIAVLREIGVDTGGSNVQFAVNPDDGRMVVIEMNPRVSRSSALASKATGFPIAKVAAKLAVGYTLDEMPNDITRVTPASFEPTIDYVVTKMPRFTFEKFPGTRAAAHHLDEVGRRGHGDRPHLRRIAAEGAALAGDRADRPQRGRDRRRRRGRPQGRASARRWRRPSPDRLLVIAQAFRDGRRRWKRSTPRASTTRGSCARSRRSWTPRPSVRRKGLPEDAPALQRLKAQGFSDARLAELAGVPEAEVAAARRRLAVHPVYKRIDTCAAEFPSLTPYMYSTYEGDGLMPAANARRTPSARKKVIILGGGPNRIGQGIEFDYCCVHAAFAWPRPATRRSWSTATRRPCPPTTTPPTGSTSSR